MVVQAGLGDETAGLGERSLGFGLERSVTMWSLALV
jgi:hypothetical protein